MGGVEVLAMLADTVCFLYGMDQGKLAVQQLATARNSPYKANRVGSLS